MGKLPKVTKRRSRTVNVMSVNAVLNPVISTSKRATIRYLRRENFLVTGAPYIRMTNFERFPEGRTPARGHDITDLHIQDIRELLEDEQPQLKTHGFSIQSFAPIFPRKHFEENHITKNLVDECHARVKELVWRKVGIVESKIVDGQLRYGPPDSGRMGPGDVPGCELPMHQPYADKWGLIGHDELEERWPEKFSQRQPGDHFGILKFWVPLTERGDERVTDWPLAICNPRSVDRNRDFQPGHIQLGGQTDMTHMAYYNPSHQWYFLSMQSGCQVWYWVLWDSYRDLPQNVMVSTFDTGAKEEKRMSLEFKVYVKYKE